MIATKVKKIYNALHNLHFDFQETIATVCVYIGADFPGNFSNTFFQKSHIESMINFSINSFNL